MNLLLGSFTFLWEIRAKHLSGKPTLRQLLDPAIYDLTKVSSPSEKHRYSR